MVKRDGRTFAYASESLWKQIRKTLLQFILKREVLKHAHFYINMIMKQHKNKTVEPRAYIFHHLGCRTEDIFEHLRLSHLREKEGGKICGGDYR